MGGSREEGAWPRGYEKEVGDPETGESRRAGMKDNINVLLRSDERT